MITVTGVILLRRFKVIGKRFKVTYTLRSMCDIHQVIEFVDRLEDCLPIESEVTWNLHLSVFNNIIELVRVKDAVTDEKSF